MNPKPASDFTLKDQNGSYFTLSENIKKYTLLVFYPKDNSFVCTKQLCDYNENIGKFLNKDIQVVGINPGKQNSHSEFSGKYNFNFPLLSDYKGTVAKKYNASGILGGTKRKLVLINKEMNIIYENNIYSLFYKTAGDILNLKILKSAK